MPCLKEVVLDYSNASLPKPVAEAWNNITLSIINCKEVDNANIISYLKLSKKITNIEFTGKLIDTNLMKVLNECVLQ